MITEQKARAYDVALEKAKSMIDDLRKGEDILAVSDLESMFPELKESDDEKIRKELIAFLKENHETGRAEETWSLSGIERWIAWLEKQKENPKSADSISSDCVSDAKCEDRWHKVDDSLPDNGRLVLANDCLGNTLLARYDGEGNWEVSVYDNDDYYCRNTITKWCEIPSEKQKEQKPADLVEEAYIENRNDGTYTCATTNDGFDVFMDGFHKGYELGIKEQTKK